MLHPKSYKRFFCGLGCSRLQRLASTRCDMSKIPVSLGKPHPTFASGCRAIPVSGSRYSYVTLRTQIERAFVPHISGSVWVSAQEVQAFGPAAMYSAQTPVRTVSTAWNLRGTLAAGQTPSDNRAAYP